MTFKKIIRKIHLVLGLSSGLVVLVLGVTGCLLAFEVEIRNLAEPYQHAEPENRPYLPPTVLKDIAEKQLVSKKALGIEYPGKARAAIALYYDATAYERVFINPYTGRVLKRVDMTKDFFRVVLDGHYYLWLPHYIGQPLAASATLIFVVMMITGLVLWWPKNKAARKQRFSVKWSAAWRRKNYDLHNVLGFYMTWVAIFIATTGLVMGFQWFAKSVYWVTSGGKAITEHKDPVSDTTKAAGAANITDHLWQNHLSRITDNESLSVYFAALPSSPVEVTVNHRPGTYYNSDNYHYDQYTGKELPGEGTYAGRFKGASAADKIARMNYDMHVGAVLGLPGKLLAFFASLIAASLPVTGTIIWLGRKKKKNNAAVQKIHLSETPAGKPKKQDLQQQNKQGY